MTAVCAPSSEAACASKPLFSAFCTGGYLLSLSYGTTFILAMLLAQRGGNEADAGLIISMAMISAIVAVIFSGHLSDRIGLARAVGLSALVLAVSCAGFATSSGVNWVLSACGFLLGIGWGVFYTLGPIIVATVIPPKTRIRHFALLSGSMMSGIGTGPIMGRLVTEFGLPLETAYWIAACACLVGSGIFFMLERPIRRIIDANGQRPVSRLTWPSFIQVSGSSARYPIIMVGLGGAVFGGLSSFQTSFASARGLDFSVFFFGFMGAAIGCRMFLSGIVTRRNPYVSSTVLASLIVLSILGFQYFAWNTWSYLGAAMLLGVGYGLTYSVINGLAANEAPEGLAPQSLLMFSLSYFLGVFGYPKLAGALIVQSGLETLLAATLVIAVLNSSITIARLLARRSGIRVRR